MEGASTRFRNMIVAARSTFYSLEPNLMEDFLNKEINFNYISEACDSLGITRSTISTPPDKPFNPPLKIYNELIIDLEIFRHSHSHLLSRKFLIKWLHCLTSLNINKLPSAVDSIFKKYTFLNKQAHRNPTALKEFIESEFFLHLTPESSPILTNDISNSITSKSCDFKCKKCDNLLVENSNLSASLLAINQEKIILEKKLKQLEKKCCHFELIKKEIKINFKKKLAKARENCINQTTSLKKVQKKKQCINK